MNTCYIHAWMHCPISIKSRMKTLLSLFFILFLSITGLKSLNAQVTLKGSVYELDANNKKVALPFANVYWEGTTTGTVTDEKGHFKVTVTEGSKRLIASFVGYTNDTLNYAGQTSYDFILLKGSQLGQVEIKDKLQGSYISKLKPMKTEVITVAGLQKLACCNLSESFENNATVDVGFSDAVTGAKQIQMLGLAGVYSQIMVENIPFTRGLGSAFGLTYVPGTWMESIQISKGTSSVVNGYESTTGQINTEFRKPWNSEKFFLNTYINNEGRYEVNAHASALLNEKLSTLVLTHVSQQVLKTDMNHDGFVDIPQSTQINLSNRWSYEKHGVTESKFGFNFLQDTRTGGQIVDHGAKEAMEKGHYLMEVVTRRAQVYDKTGFMFRNKPNTSLGLIFSGLYHTQESTFGRSEYNATQAGFYGNAIFQSGSPVHGYNVGVSMMYDNYDETYADSSFSRIESVPGVFAQYTFTPGEKMNIIAGIRADQHNIYGTLITPRFHFKVNLFEHTVLRGSAGKGFRSPSILAENTGLLVSSRKMIFREDFKMEEAWNYGINLTQDINFNEEKSISLAVDFYRTDFINQVIVDLDESANRVVFYNLNGKSYSNSFQVDLTANVIKGVEFTAAYRLNDTKVTTGGELRERALVSRHKGLFTASYATRFDKWKFDFTSQYNGQTRLPEGIFIHKDDAPQTYSPDYITIHAQITRKFKKWDVYFGGENLTNFKQDHPVLGYKNPFDEGFDAGMIWGPVFGRMFYAGVRFSVTRD